MTEAMVETLTGDGSGERLDVFLCRALGVTRSFAQRLLKEGRVAGEGKLKPSARVLPAARYQVTLPPPEGMEIEPEPVDFDVVYQDRDLAVVNKPAGLVVHPAPGHWRGTLVHGLLHRWPETRLLRNRLRPGIVHRLDAGTSGLMVVALRQEVMEELQRMFQERRVTKEYIALLQGAPSSPAGTLSGPIARDPDNPLRMAVVEWGRPSLTGYRLLWSRWGASLAVCSLHTGRTHQIRVHMAALGCPLAGDALYGASLGGELGRVFLHSWRLAFPHPVTGAPLDFRLPLPGELAAYLAALRCAAC